MSGEDIQRCKRFLEEPKIKKLNSRRFKEIPTNIKWFQGGSR